jgi:hypothetical protein
VQQIVISSPHFTALSRKRLARLFFLSHESVALRCSYSLNQFFDFSRKIGMSPCLRTYFNRCRVCLERFYEDERTSKITSFFEIQFKSFTSMEVWKNLLRGAQVLMTFCSLVAVEQLRPDVETCLRVLSLRAAEIFRLQKRLD